MDTLNTSFTRWCQQMIPSPESQVINDRVKTYFLRGMRHLLRMSVGQESFGSSNIDPSLMTTARLNNQTKRKLIKHVRHLGWFLYYKAAPLVINSWEVQCAWEKLLKKCEKLLKKCEQATEEVQRLQELLIACQADLARCREEIIRLQAQIVLKQQEAISSLQATALPCQPGDKTSSPLKRVCTTSQTLTDTKRVRSTTQPSSGSDAPEQMSSTLHPTPQTDRPVLLKFRKGNTIHRFKIYEKTPLSVPLGHIASMYETEASQLILQLNDETLDSSKSSEQLGSVADIIDVLVANDATSLPGAMTIKVVKSNDYQHSVKEITVFKDEPLMNHFNHVTRLFGYKRAVFYFEGEPVDPKRTPAELEMENYDMIDIVET